MAAQKPKLRPRRVGGITEVASEHLYKSGPMLESDLFAALGHPTPTMQQIESLQCGISAGWLAIGQGGKIDCSAMARAHYDEQEGKNPVVHVGQVAAPRDAINMLNRPPLRKAYMPNSRGLRQDLPDFSVRSEPSFYKRG